MQQLTIIATFDSFLNQGLYLARLIKPKKVVVYIRLSQQDQLSERQLKQAQKIYPFEFRFFYLNQIEKIKLEEGSWVVLSCGNSFAETFLKSREEQGLTNKIKVITLFAGVILEDVASIQSRLKSDILLLPSKKDWQLAHNLAQNTVAQQHNSTTAQLINFGLPCEYQALTLNNSEVENIYYIDQLIVPSEKTDRESVLQSLINLAKKHPQKNFFILCRTIDKERTVWKSQYPLQHLQLSLKLPKNLNFSYQEREEVFKNASMILTFTSSIGFEGIKRGIPVRFLSDFGVQDQWRNLSLQHSGVFTTIEKSLIKMLEVNNEWKEDYVENDSEGLVKLFTYLHTDKFQNPQLFNLMPIQRYSLFNLNYWKLILQGLKLKRAVKVLKK